MIKHTPGPWIVNPIPLGSVELADGTVIAQAQQVGRNDAAGHAIRQANARLVAASPDLLSIAKSVLTALAYPRGSEAQVRCLEEIGQDARYVLSKVDAP